MVILKALLFVQVKFVYSEKPTNTGKTFYGSKESDVRDFIFL